MKYGLLDYTSGLLNTGDFFQLAGSIEAYKRLGIPQEAIIRIERNKLDQYDGEYCILPMSGYFNNYDWTSSKKQKRKILSEKIIPVFIGMHAPREGQVAEFKEYSHFGPFGCRDVETMKAFRRAGMDAYVSGCLSICVPKIENPAGTKTFLLDVPDEAYPFIPEEILKDAVEFPSTFRSFGKRGGIKGSERMESFDVCYGEYREQNREGCLSFLDEMVRQIKSEAKLIVTSRLHVALPFTAMGIPVITLHKSMGDMRDCRFSGLDRLINCYHPSEYADIDWNPKVPDLEDLKEKTIRTTVKMIRRAAEKYKDLCELSDFYEEYAAKKMYYLGPHVSYLTEAQKQEFILRQGEARGYCDETNWLEFVTNKTLKKSHLIVYGAGDAARWMLRRYKKYCDQALTFDLVDGNQEKWGKRMEIDTYDRMLLFSYEIKSPEIIRNYEKDSLLIIVAANNYFLDSGRAIAKVLMEEFGLQEEKHFFMLDKLNNSMSIKITEAACTVDQLDWL